MATKEAYQQKLKAQLDEWDAKLDVLSAKAKKATADVRIGYENELEALREKRASARRTLDELGARGEHAWDDMKVGLERLREDIGTAIERLAARFK